MRVWRLVLVTLLALAASPAGATTVLVSDDHGGFLFLYRKQWVDLGAQKVNVEIVGPCVSACTILLGYIPNKNICVTPKASLGFHQGTLPVITEELLRAYPPNIRSWISDHGGLTSQLIWLGPPEIYRFFRKCRTDAPAAPDKRL
jgi:hypothetical protein